MLHQPSFWEFVHEFIGHYFAIEGGKLWTSLWLMLVRPGQLTVDYLEGRRARHVLPLHLLLSFGLLCLLTIKLRALVIHDPQARAWLNLGLVPYAVLVALPVLAAALMAIFRNRRRPFGEHMVFAVHQQAGVYLMIALSVGFEMLGLHWLEYPPLVWILLAPWIALRRVYGGRWWTVSLRFLGYQCAYLLVAFLAIFPLAALYK
ncbi:DUF3667 domain-containing protein [Inhella sp.]|uniref:DUF3667 domain-containing protein n=1 Tax=Inhella sp. TaxID=1921806 RepID=UPI0035B1C47A